MDLFYDTSMVLLSNNYILQMFQMFLKFHGSKSYRFENNMRVNKMTNIYF